jgi:hypothetical protein
MVNTLLGLGLQRNRVMLLSETPGHSLPTTAGILHALDWLVAGATPDSVLWLYFTGRSWHKHMPAASSLHAVSVLLGSDWETVGAIGEGELCARFAKLPRGATLYFILDAPALNTVFDLRCVHFPAPTSVGPREKASMLTEPAAVSIRGACGYWEEDLSLPETGADAGTVVLIQATYDFVKGSALPCGEEAERCVGRLTGALLPRLKLGHPWGLLVPALSVDVFRLPQPLLVLLQATHPLELRHPAFHRALRYSLGRRHLFFYTNYSDSFVHKPSDTKQIFSTNQQLKRSSCHLIGLDGENLTRCHHLLIYCCHQ